jgi:AcrR family transcriptional regulator
VTTQRGAETRQQLLAAATTVFSQRGFARATTKEIAQVAGVAEGTIYRHFADKQDLFYAAFSAKRAIMADEFLRLPELAGKETIRENLRRFISVIEDIERTIAPLQASMWSDKELMEQLPASERSGGPGAGEGRDAGTGGGEGGGEGRPAGPLGPLAEYLKAEQALGRIRGDADCERAAFALFAIPFASVMMSRLSSGQVFAEDLDIMGALDIVLEGLLP